MDLLTSKRKMYKIFCHITFIPNRKLGDGKSENGSEVQTNPGNAEIVTTNINWKNKLQELFQKSGLPAPKYRQHPALDGWVLSGLKILWMVS